MYFPSGDFSHYKSLTDVVEEHGKHMTRYHDPPGCILLMCLFNPLQHCPGDSASECLQCQPFVVQTPIPTGAGTWELPGGELAWLLGKQSGEHGNRQGAGCTAPTEPGSECLL